MNSMKIMTSFTLWHINYNFLFFYNKQKPETIVKLCRTFPILITINFIEENFN